MLSAIVLVSSSLISLSPQSFPFLPFSEMKDQQSSLRFHQFAGVMQSSCVRERERKREEDAGIGADRAQSGKASITTVGPVTSAGMLMYPNSYLP